MADIVESAAQTAGTDVAPVTSHDDAPPPALLAFMVTGWAAKGSLPELLEGAETFPRPA